MNSVLPTPKRSDNAYGESYYQSYKQRWLDITTCHEHEKISSGSPLGYKTSTKPSNQDHRKRIAMRTHRRRHTMKVRKPNRQGLRKRVINPTTDDHRRAVAAIKTGLEITTVGVVAREIEKGTPEAKNVLIVGRRATSRGTAGLRRTPHARVAVRERAHSDGRAIPLLAVGTTRSSATTATRWGTTPLRVPNHVNPEAHRHRSRLSREKRNPS